ncbi:MAG: AzlD domain-containing protein [Corynebacterium sp.]|uniref:AzlD domain-containing protein n=1 Tax=Corynebacterium TaxID=1716 RepID=UPI00254F1A14|nr:MULTISPECIES: AzlD domain-containing protein [Corynebacterium]MDK8767876.1 AzlD domain-containing protein [Corynebacterium freneyi]MDY0113501.1 AzlD domain-containing protein [Corynebacterium sp.]
MINPWIAVAVMFAVTYALRAVPLLLVRGELRNRRLRTFLEFTPYAVLTAMTLPAVIHATAHWWSGVAGIVAAIVLAWRGMSLMPVAIGAAVTVWIAEMASALV